MNKFEYKLNITKIKRAKTGKALEELTRTFIEQLPSAWKFLSSNDNIESVVNTVKCAILSRNRYVELNLKSTLPNFIGEHIRAIQNSLRKLFVLKGVDKSVIDNLEEFCDGAYYGYLDKATLLTLLTCYKDELPRFKLEFTPTIPFFIEALNREVNFNVDTIMHYEYMRTVDGVKSVLLDELIKNELDKLSEEDTTDAAKLITHVNEYNAAAEAVITNLQSVT
jgi:hypothetical protein